MMKPTFAIYGIKDRFQSQYPTYVHNHNLTLMENGQVKQYLELERYTRRKYDNRLDQFIEELLDKKLIDLPEDFDIVSVNSFAGNHFISKQGRLRVEAKPFPSVKDLFTEGYAYYEKKSYQGKEIDAYLVPHEIAHIFSTLPFSGKFKENSLLVHFDGGASQSNFTAFIYKNQKLYFLESHWKLSYLSKFFNDNALNFAILGAKKGEHTSLPGKLMGFASFGTYSPELEKWLLENNFFKDIWHNYEIFFKKAKADFGIDIENFDTKNPFLQDIAATFQKIFENQTFEKIYKLQKLTQTEYLYYSGGSALNIITNSKIVYSGIFKDVFIPPPCNDTGLSLGAAAFIEWKKGNIIKKHSPYLNNIACDLKAEYHYKPDLIKEVADLLLKNKVIGVANGYAEAGPRALGNRSIIALPNSKELAQKVSQYHKRREWYRPVAPIMLKELAQKVTGEKIHHLAKFMLLNFNILPQYRKNLEGVVHIDGSARIQILEQRKDNPFMYDLLKFLWEKHKIYALINTSFNSKGEPIVHTPNDAIQAAKKMDLDAIVIDYKLTKLKHNEL